MAAIGIGAGTMLILTSPAISALVGNPFKALQVNDILLRYHEDYAGLRRDLVDFGFLRRERGGSQYWLTPEGENV